MYKTVLTENVICMYIDKIKKNGKISDKKRKHPFLLC